MCRAAKGVHVLGGGHQDREVGDALVAAFDGDVLRAALENVAIHEKRGDVEQWW